MRTASLRALPMIHGNFLTSGFGAAATLQHQSFRVLTDFWRTASPWRRALFTPAAARRKL